MTPERCIDCEGLGEVCRSCGGSGRVGQGDGVPMDGLVRATLALRRAGVASDVLELLIHGSPRLSVRPGALQSALDAYKNGG